jgi:hypothetical protein
MTNFSALERLVAIEDIRRLKAERDRAVDERDWELYKSMHTPDFVSYKPGGKTGSARKWQRMRPPPFYEA